MKKIQELVIVLSTDKLFKNILKLEQEIGRLEFFTLLLLRISLLFIIDQVVRYPALLLVLCFYFIYDLINGRIKNLKAGKFIVICISIFFSIYVYVGLNFTNFLTSRYYPLFLSTTGDNHYMHMMEILNSSKLVYIDNIILSISGFITFISFLFLILKKGANVANPLIPSAEVFGGKSLLWHFFSFKGVSTRINYAYSWFFVQLILVGIYSILLVILFITNDFSLNSSFSTIYNFAENNPFVLYLSLGINTLFGLLTFFAITIKRLHHLGHKGYWVWLLLLLSILFILTHPVLQNAVVNIIIGNRGPEYMVAFHNYIASKISMIVSFFRILYLIFIFYLVFYPGKSDRKTI